jgi:hypothetical protein
MVTALEAQTPATPAGRPVTVAPVAAVVAYVILVMADPWHVDWLLVPDAELSVMPQLTGAADPHVMLPSTKLQFGITSANSSAYSQFPGVATSHFTELFPVATTTKRRSNIKPLKATGTKLNHAALN